MDIRLTLYGNPMSTQHLYGYSGKIKYMKKEAKTRKNSYIQDIKDQYFGEIIDKRVQIEIRLYFGDRRRRDFDNFHKISIDALVGTVLTDDDLIYRAKIEKYYDKKNPRIEFRITPFVDDPDHY